ncbi:MULTISPECIES: ABC transporter permease [Amycolatopsis]|uniref:ABC transporter permease n=1 Tax=Amycolatopsis dendrobii TaxID=2760662 RepID=A0A7W3VTD2_9PSEU|nr:MULTISPECIES: ABC transporter permease [Amycolatopsis]MBB1152282.1 ABC transporter permease [Amycolatopsis dendrobii]UKD57446.1 ABC transporter permease [Amycolatopsis sp. FU40]
MNSAAGAGALLRLALRRDRVRLPVWIVVSAAMTAAAAAATAGVYPTDEARRAAVASINAVPALVALYGPIAEPTAGAAAVFKLTASGAALVALLTALTAVRHTRAEEETGRWELLRGAATGRHAGLAAAGAMLVLTAFGLGAGATAGLAAAGLPFGGSLAFGLGWAGAGLVFGALAGLAAQVARGGRTATEITVLALVVAYLLRAAGDATGPRWLSWLSPIGWASLLRPFAGDRWWLLAFPLAASLLLGFAAFAVSRHRDLGAGLLAVRSGATRAGRLLSGPAGLAWRLDRGAVASWTLAFAVLGLVVGNLADSLGTFFSTAQARQLIAALGGEQALTDAFLAAEFGVSGVLVSALAIVLVGRLRTEESSGRAAAVLAGPVARARLVGGAVSVTVAATAAPLLAAGATAGLAHGDVSRLVGAAVVQLPGVWVLTGLALAVFGAFPRAGWLSWAALAAFLVLGEFGPLFHAPGWALGISPFSHVPHVPGGVVDIGPLLWLAAVAALLGGAGFAAFGRRDLIA